MEIKAMFPGKYVIYHGHDIKEEILFDLNNHVHKTIIIPDLIYSHPVTIDKAFKIAHNFLHAAFPNREQHYSRLWKHPNFDNVVIEDYGSWSNFLYFIKVGD